jgi:hypothetical protein
MTDNNNEMIIDQEPEKEQALAPLPETGLYSLEPRTLKEVQSIALVFAQSGMFEGVNAMAHAFVKIMQGRELGFTAVESMTGIHVIKGKPVVGAHLIAAGIRRSSQYDYDVEELDNERCTIVLFKNGKPFKRETFTIEDAKQAGLTNSNNWQKYPRNMLFARTISNIQKFHCPDVFNMPVYGPDEMGLDVDEQGNAIIEGEFEYVPETRPAPKDKPAERKSKPHQQTPPTPPKPDQKEKMWQDHIEGWTQQKWGEYWIAMKSIGLDKKGRLAIEQATRPIGLTNDEVHAALGVESVKDFQDTYAAHQAAILDAVTKKAKAQQSTTKPGTPFAPPADDEPTEHQSKGVSMSGDFGEITASRVILIDRTKTETYNNPLIEVFAINENTGEEDPMPAIPQRELLDDEVELLNKVIPFPAKIGKVQGSMWYSFEDASEEDPNDPKLVLLTWERENEVAIITEVNII